MDLSYETIDPKKSINQYIQVLACDLNCLEMWIPYSDYVSAASFQYYGVTLEVADEF